MHIEFYKQIKNSGRVSLFFIVFITTSITACSEQSSSRLSNVFSGPIMGTEYKITVVSENHISDDSLEMELLGKMQRINSLMSTYLATSEISAINQASSVEPIALSSETHQVIELAQTIAQLTGGAFDITVAPVVDLWGFGPTGSIDKKPKEPVLEGLRDVVGYKNLLLENNVLRKKHSETQIDLSAIAKGYAVDQVAEVLVARGYQDFLIDIGGELRASGLNVNNQSWRVGIEKPRLAGSIQHIVKLNNMAIATSGDYLNFVVLNDQRYSHTINPVSLSPVLHKLALVSVIDQNASRADALATAIMVMGDEKGYEFAQANDIAAYFVIRTNDEQFFNVKQTSKFVQYSQ